MYMCWYIKGKVWGGGKKIPFLCGTWHFCVQWHKITCYALRAQSIRWHRICFPFGGKICSSVHGEDNSTKNSCNVLLQAYYMPMNESFAPVNGCSHSSYRALMESPAGTKLKHWLYWLHIILSGFQMQKRGNRIAQRKGGRDDNPR